MNVKWHPKAAYPSFLVLLLALAGGCASEGPGVLRTQTSDPKPVDARADNASVLGELTPGLVVTLAIDGNKVSLADVQVLMIPRPKPRQAKGELITVTAVSDGKAVSSVRVPDQRLNVQENVGLVVLDKRTVIASLPLPTRVDALEVQLPGEAKAERFDVRRQIDEFCKERRQLRLCQP